MIILSNTFSYKCGLLFSSKANVWIVIFFGDINKIDAILIIFIIKLKDFLH